MEKYKALRKVVGYIRVSTEKQTEKYGILRQEEAIKKYCEQNEVELVKIYTDAGVSGALKDDEDEPSKRVELLQMLNDLMEDGTIEQVVVIKLDRLWRNTAAEEYVCKRLRRLHVDIASVEEYDFSLYADDPAQKFMNRIMAAVAEYDYAMIKKRMYDGTKAKAEVTGNRPSGSQPYGYKYSNDKKTSLIDTTEAPIVREIFQLRKQGKTLAEIEDILYKKGCVNRNGNSFSQMAISYILRNPFYCGILTYSGKQIQGQHTPLIPREDFEYLNPKIKLTV